MTKQNILIRMLALFLIVINLGSSFGVYAQEPELLSPILKSDDKNTDILFDGEVDDPSEEEINAPWLLNREDELSSFSFESFYRGDDKSGQKSGYDPRDSGPPLLTSPIVPKDTPILKLKGEEYKTDLFTGAASYSYPIEVPKGVNNIAPALVLYYNHHATLGAQDIVGSGWNLPIPSITRDVNYTRSNTADDSYRISFEGTQDELLYVTSEDRYHTKHESFLWIKKVSGGANERGEYWLVKTKDGTSYRFGFTNTSEIVSTLEPYAVRWNLDRVEDSHGNVMDYVYYDSGAVSYPLEIRYADGLNLVRFIYSNSSQNQRSFYSQGSEMREPPLLGQIEITHRGNLVRSYELSYVPLETRSFLESIRLIGSDGILSLPATRFSYAAVGGGWVEQGNLALPSGVSFGTTRDQGVRLVDVTGDGFTDIIRAANSNAVEQWDGVGNGWASPGRNSLNGLVSGGFVDQYGGDQGIRFVDINGDTRVDVLQIVSGTNILRRALLNRGNSWEADSLNIPSEISFNELRSSCVPEYCPSGYDETGFNCDSNGCTRACAQVTCSGSGNLVRSGVAQDPQWNDDDHDESDAGPSFTPAPNKCYKFEYIGSFDTDGDDSECYDLTTDDDYGDYDISCNGEDENAYGSLGFSGNRQSA